MKKIVAILFIILGMSIMLYPKASQLYKDYKQKQLLVEWHEQTKMESLQQLEKVFDHETFDEPISNPPPNENQESYETSNIIGKLEISKISVELPILEGATMENLDIAAGHLTGTSELGKAGNSAIAAHRSRTYGVMFNRLNEIKSGDEIIVEDRQNKYIYVVYDTLIVEPNDLTVLANKGQDKILTLITCTPIDTGTHRLIVHANLNKTVEKS